MIPGVIISLLTFPGVVVHELGHLALCRVFGIAVHKVCYFRLGNPAGYVIHDKPSSALQQIAIGFGPFLVNTVLGFALGMFTAVARTDRAAMPFWLPAALAWLSISIGMHAFPSTGDAGSIWRALWARDVAWPVRILGIPLVGVIYAGAIGSIFWLDLVYGIGVLWLALLLSARLG